MIYIIRKKISYQDFGHERIDIGLYCVEERHIYNQKEYALFGA